jgi:hypothetical protein
VGYNKLSKPQAPLAKGIIPVDDRLSKTTVAVKFMRCLFNTRALVYLFLLFAMVNLIFMSEYHAPHVRK